MREVGCISYSNRSIAITLVTHALVAKSLVANVLNGSEVGVEEKCIPVSIVLKVGAVA